MPTSPPPTNCDEAAICLLNSGARTVTPPKAACPISRPTLRPSVALDPGDTRRGWLNGSPTQNPCDPALPCPRSSTERTPPPTPTPLLPFSVHSRQRTLLHRLRPLRPNSWKPESPYMRSSTASHATWLPKTPRPTRPRSPKNRCWPNSSREPWSPSSGSPPNTSHGSGCPTSSCPTTKPPSWLPTSNRPLTNPRNVLSPPMRH